MDETSYQPTREDIRQGEEMMTEDEAKMSEERFKEIKGNEIYNVEKSFVLRGSSNAEYTNEFKKLNSETKDTLLLAAMLTPYRLDRSDWLDMLDHATDQRQEQMLHDLVEARLSREKMGTQEAFKYPLWIALACRKAQAKGWDIPEDWLQLLKASIAISKATHYDTGAFGGFTNNCQKWLEEYEKSAKE